MVAIGCDGSATATLTTVVSVNEFDSSATQPTEPRPLLEAEQERITITGIPITGEIYSVTSGAIVMDPVAETCAAGSLQPNALFTVEIVNT